MGLSLSKGQSLSLTKADGGRLTKVRMGLGWDSAAPVKRGLFGRGKAAEVDLDASAIFFDAAGKVLDTVWFQQLSSKDGSTTHTGDNLTGAGDGDDETILVDLTKVSASVAQIVFVISSYTQQTFDSVENAFSRIVDDSTSGTPDDHVEGFARWRRLELQGCRRARQRSFRDGPARAGRTGSLGSAFSVQHHSTTALPLTTIDKGEISWQASLFKRETTSH
jgi:tellurium resistance protein TerZ